MLPAEKTHYRKGLALGLTLAETFSIIVFVLLLAAAFLLANTMDEARAAQEELAETQVDLGIAKEMLGGGDGYSSANADAWFERSRELALQRDSALLLVEEIRRELVIVQARAEQAILLAEEVGVTTTTEVEVSTVTLERMETLATELAVLQDSIASFEQQAMEQQARADSLAELLSDIQRESYLASEDGTNFVANLQSRAAVVDSLQNLLAVAERERGEAIRARENLEMHLSGGIGIEPPPCWLDKDGNPEYIFRVELTDRGFRMFNITADHNLSDPVMLFAGQIEDGREYTPGEFAQLTQPIYEMSVSRTETFGRKGCRYWVRPVDSTGDKDTFTDRWERLGSHFYFRW